MARLLDGLADDWEDDKAIRRRASDGKSLIQWPSPASVGIPTLSFGCMIQFYADCVPIIIVTSSSATAES